MNATIKITRDRIFDGEDITESYKGRTFTFGDGCVVTTHRVRWSLVDDDGITYYEGTVKAADEATLDEALDWLFDWGAADSGTTLLKVDGKPYIG